MIQCIHLLYVQNEVTAPGMHHFQIRSLDIKKKHLLGRVINFDFGGGATLWEELILLEGKGT